jgi:hypothetical protein
MMPNKGLAVNSRGITDSLMMFRSMARWPEEKKFANTIAFQCYRNDAFVLIRGFVALELSFSRCQSLGVNRHNSRRRFSLGTEDSRVKGKRGISPGI